MKKTVTSIFMVPCLNIGKHTLDKFGFINGYSDLKDKELAYGEEVIFLLFKPKDILVFKHFLEDQYDSAKNIVEDFGYAEGYVVIAYSLPLEFESDFRLIRQGLYSETSKEFKDLFPDKIKTVSKIGLASRDYSLQYLIFNKDANLRNYWKNKIGIDDTGIDDMEVWPLFMLEKETLNITEHYENKEETTE